MSLSDKSTLITFCMRDHKEDIFKNLLIDININILNIVLIDKIDSHMKNLKYLVITAV